MAKATARHADPAPMSVYSYDGRCRESALTRRLPGSQTSASYCVTAARCRAAGPGVDISPPILALRTPAARAPSPCSAEMGTDGPVDDQHPRQSVGQVRRYATKPLPLAQLGASDLRPHTGIPMNPNSVPACRAASPWRASPAQHRHTQRLRLPGMTASARSDLRSHTS